MPRRFERPFPFVGEVIWLTADQGGRKNGPPPNPGEFDYAVTAFVPPSGEHASFVLGDFSPTLWRSPAVGRWLLITNSEAWRVEPGSAVFVCEGRRVVAIFHVHEVDESALPLHAIEP